MLASVSTQNKQVFQVSITSTNSGRCIVQIYSCKHDTSFHHFLDAHSLPVVSTDRQTSHQAFVSEHVSIKAYGQHKQLVPSSNTASYHFKMSNPRKITTARKSVGLATPPTRKPPTARKSAPVYASASRKTTPRYPTRNQTQPRKKISKPRHKRKYNNKNSSTFPTEQC